MSIPDGSTNHDQSEGHAPPSLWPLLAVVMGKRLKPCFCHAGPFIIFNEADEAASLKRFFTHMQEVGPLSRLSILSFRTSTMIRSAFASIIAQAGDAHASIAAQAGDGSTKASSVK